jgi:hypothetical protein
LFSGSLVVSTTVWFSRRISDRASQRESLQLIIEFDLHVIGSGTTQGFRELAVRLNKLTACRGWQKYPLFFRPEGLRQGWGNLLAVKPTEDVKLRVYIEPQRPSRHTDVQLKPLFSHENNSLVDPVMALHSYRNRNPKEIQTTWLNLFKMRCKNITVSFHPGFYLANPYLRSPGSSYPLVKLALKVDRRNLLEAVPDIVKRGESEFILSIKTLETFHKEFVSQLHAKHVEEHEGFAVAHSFG